MGTTLLPNNMSAPTPVMATVTIDETAATATITTDKIDVAATQLGYYIPKTKLAFTPHEEERIEFIRKLLIPNRTAIFYTNYPHFIQDQKWMRPSILYQNIKTLQKKLPPSAWFYSCMTAKDWKKLQTKDTFYASIALARSARRDAWIVTPVGTDPMVRPDLKTGITWYDYELPVLVAEGGVDRIWHYSCEAGGKATKRLVWEREGCAVEEVRKMEEVGNGVLKRFKKRMAKLIDIYVGA